MSMPRLIVPYVRPLGVFLGVYLLLVAMDGGGTRLLNSSFLFGILQLFATIGPIALGVGMSMLIREFDLSVAGMVGMAGCIAVLTGGTYPVVGLATALGVGFLAGLIQGWIIARLRLSSIGVTLGGLLVFFGVSYALTESRSIEYPNLDVAAALGRHVLGIFTIPSLTSVIIYIIVALVFGLTKLGRDLIAVGGDRRAAISAGVRVNVLLIGTFCFSGTLAAMCGALLGYSLASAAPTGLANVLVPATTAAILGGVSLSGGTGRPIGIALGALTLGTLQSGLNVLDVSSYAHEILVGLVLLAIAVFDSRGLATRLQQLRLVLGRVQNA
jgi:ribose/xylose/arabinose/galactoside ABC-type transport system permease subunit